MISILSLVTSVKDYVEVVHKLIESDSSFKISDYSDLGPIITYIIITLKEFLINLISLNWLKSLWDLPIIIPNISSAMVSEISVLDGYVHNAFNFLDTPLSYGDSNLAVSSLEKLTIGLINSLFIFIPTGTAHLITLRRFVMQGLEAGYISGLGSICGNILWITSIIFGWRFFVIPWLSLDIFRYILGFVILVKYMWDSYNERKTSITSEPAKQKIFLLNFLLALTEQTSIYPFISNISIGSESSILEGFPAQNWSDFLIIHGSYILGLTLGCLSLLQLTCWFWENPAFKIYMWMISSFKVSTSFYYKVLNFTFLYLTMICAISSIPYYGLDYALTNPIGFVQDDRILDQKLINPSALSFLNSKASDRNTRRNRGRHGRRERWKRRIRKYRTFDASLYDQGIYDLFTIEDLNYGFDRFWLRRKMRNHTVRFRFFPGPWMRSFKKQLAKPRLESYAGPRQEFFRILFEQVYHPSFHEYSKEVEISEKNKLNGGNLKQKLSLIKTNVNDSVSVNNISNLVLNNKPMYLLPKKELSIYLNFEENGSTINNNLKIKENLKIENSTLRKFVRKINNRIKNLEIKTNFKNNDLLNTSKTKPLYSKRWKQIFSKLNHSRSSELTTNNRPLKGLLKNFYQNSLSGNGSSSNMNSINISSSIKKQNSLINLSKKDEQILKYRSIFLNKSSLNKTSKIGNESNLWLTNNTINFLHPLKFYLKKQQSFERKLRYYTPTIFRKFSIENNAPYFRIMMKRYFYYFKPTLRWEKTMKVGSLRKARRKTSTSARKIQFTDNSLKSLAVNQFINKNSNTTTDTFNSNNLIDQTKSFTWKNRIVKPTHNYTIVGKRASRYRYQIYKDVLQHWYYSPFNRLLLKLDIDLFIKRQPKPHFIGKNEANLLFLRRSLLTEHYNTLRWYTYMQHYRSMKTKIGGTKSFASGAYNQQFSGTFKKIRHLFAITPSQKNQTILKFDQPLYNEYYNNSKDNYQKNFLIHEELLTDTEGKINNDLILGNDLLNQSNQILRDYLIKSYPIKKEYITNLIENKNYDELTKFLYKGEKIRGDKPVINQKNFITQEKEYLLTKTEKEELINLDKLKLDSFLRPVQQDLWINLLKKWKRKINDQEFLKNYLQRRVEKSEKRRIKKEKNLKNKLQRLENLFTEKENNNQSNFTLNSLNQSSNLMSTGVQKALIEGVSILDQASSDLNKTNLFKLNNIQNKNTFLTNSNKIEIKTLQETLIRNKEKQLKYSLDNLSKLIKKVPFKQINKKNNLSQSRNNFKNNDKFLFNSLNRKQITSKIKSIYTRLKLYSTKLVKIKLINILKPIRNKTVKNWQQEERSLNKQKRVRKEFKTFIKKPFKDITMSLNEKESNNILKKRDYSNNENINNELSLSKQIWGGVKKTYNTYLTKKFKRKKSPQRRARTRKNRGVTKKRTLSDSLKREFKNIRKYNLSSDKEQKTYRSIAALNFYSSINKEFTLNSKESFKRVPLQRRSKQKKQRYWKQKRSKFSQNLRKYKKRRRSVLAKVRILNKQLKRIKSTTDLKNWWWANFLPNFRATINSLWQNEKDQYLLQKLLGLSNLEIIERDKLTYLDKNSINFGQSDINRLQVGNFDYKPLALPTTTKMVNDLKSLNENKTLFEKESLDKNSFISNSLNNSNTDKNDIISNVVKTTLLPENQNGIKSNNQVVITNPIPFYAGWDESLRKFVVTNRLLSRRESGNEMDLQDQYQKEFKSLLNQETSQNTLTFNAAPLKGMNAATTLYWQIPFTTYDPDQFFALGMDGFAPLGWRRFQFRHSILKSWLYDKTINSVENKSNKNNSLNNYIVKNKSNIIESKQSLINNKFTKIYNKNIRNINRRVKKRYRRVKKHPRSPVWFPSGPLLNQVLPVHYIYIFYKRSRLPRDRYIKRRLRKSKTINLNKNNTITSQQAPDFTLRKRIKTKRKYHIKQTLNRKSPIIPRRMIFIGDDSSLIRWRPLSKQKLNKPIAELIKEQRTLRSKQRKKEQQDVNNKQPANIRVKQLRRRVQRQIIRSVWRYKPRAGGFVWPGDYLKLELQKAPKLKSLDKITVESNSDSIKNSSTNIKMKRKKKRNIQEWQIQTKKYLLQKHNYNVIKKKLEKAHRSNKIKERIKELNLTL